MGLVVGGDERAITGPELAGIIVNEQDVHVAQFTLGCRTTRARDERGQKSDGGQKATGHGSFGGSATDIAYFRA